jgi:hypothetical protein
MDGFRPRFASGFDSCSSCSTIQASILASGQPELWNDLKMAAGVIRRPAWLSELVEAKQLGHARLSRPGPSSGKLGKRSVRDCKNLYRSFLLRKQYVGNMASDCLAISTHPVKKVIYAFAVHQPLLRQRAMLQHCFRATLSRPAISGKLTIK